MLLPPGMTKANRLQHCPPPLPLEFRMPKLAPVPAQFISEQENDTISRLWQRAKNDTTSGLWRQRLALAAAGFGGSTGKRSPKRGHERSAAGARSWLLHVATIVMALMLALAVAVVIAYGGCTGRDGPDE
mmetsp:Transcript_10215/g.20827  ORF Transcript_10215/g.20827 Transcript_10215/m.20827 type:complete len:130 (-) Transcript_10215:370-759(-)